MLSLVRDFLNSFGKDYESQGGLAAVKRGANLRLAVTRYLSGAPLSKIEGVGLNSYGWPVELQPWLPFITDNLYLKALFTCLQVGRAFRFKPVLDVSTIVAPSKARPLITIGDQFSAILRSLGCRPRSVEWSNYHFSTKSGPNGPALAHALTDLAALSQNQRDNIIALGGDAVRLAMHKPFMQTPLGYSMMEIWAKLYPTSKAYTRKLSYFADKGGKTRVIAILDYWSQSVLKPVHDVLMDILRGIPTDCTFNQGAFSSILPLSGPFFSFDLSAATDRMPLALQQRVLSFVIGRGKAEAWAKLLVSEGYVAKSLPDLVYYKAGQPMGAYSS